MKAKAAFVKFKIKTNNRSNKNVAINFTDTNSEFIIKNQTSIIKKSRSSNIELLRFICAIFTVFLHQAGSEFVDTNNWLFVNLNSYVTSPVIVFAFLTGYFLADNTKSKFFNFLPTILFYYLINIILGFLIIHYNNLNQIYSIKKLFIFGGRDWWYLWTIPLVYLLAPAINIAIKTFDQKLTLMTIIFLYGLFFIFTNGILEGAFFGAKQLLFLTIIYSLGVWWKNNESLFQNKKTLITYISVIFLLLLQLINNLMFLTTRSMLPISATYPLALFTALALFFIFQQFKIKDNKIINYLGAMSLPIYLFHYLFEFWFYNKIIVNFNIIDLNLKLVVSFCLIASVSIMFAIVLVYLQNYYNKFVHFITSNKKWHRA